MKLIIRRDQKARTGILGGHKGMLFQLSMRVQLTPEEQELVKRYKAEEHPLTTRTDSDGREIPGTTVSDLLRGISTEVSDIGVLLNNEEVIKNACQSFKTLLEVMTTFGGEEIIEV